jgi:hypothetical protein
VAEIPLDELNILAGKPVRCRWSQNRPQAGYRRVPLSHHREEDRGGQEREDQVFGAHRGKLCHEGGSCALLKPFSLRMSWSRALAEVRNPKGQAFVESHFSQTKREMGHPEDALTETCD